MNGTTPSTSAPPAPLKTAPGRPQAAPRPPVKPDADNPALRVLAYIKLHWLTILFAGALLGAGLAFAAWTFLPPKYESYALFRVSQIPSSVTGSGDPQRRTNFATDVKTSANMMKTDLVYRVALGNEKLRISELPTFKDFKDKDFLKFFDEQLMVSSNEGSEIIRLSLKGDNGDDVRKIIDAVVLAYEKEVILKERTERRDLKISLASTKVKLENTLKALSGQTTTDAGNAMVAVPGAMPGPMPEGKLPPVVAPPGGIKQVDNKQPLAPVDNKVVQAAMIGESVRIDHSDDTERMKEARFNAIINRYNTLEAKLPDLDFQISLAKGRIESLKKDLQSFLDEAAPEEIGKAVRQGDAEYLAADKKAERLAKQFQNKLSESVNKDAESIKQLERDVELARIECEKVYRDKVKLLDKVRREPKQRELTALQEKAQAELAALADLKSKTLTQIAFAQEELKARPALPGPELRKEEQAKKVNSTDLDIKVIQDQLSKTSAMLQATELEAEIPTRISILQPASTPVQRDTQKQILATVFGGLMGFALVAGLMVALEMRARKLTSLTELKSLGTVPVVGVVPWRPDASTGRDPAKRADVNEAIDKLRSYVSQAWLARGATTITVTSPLGDEGKSFTAFGLASSLAQSGYKTLLVDFDLRDPSLHTYAGVVNAQGVCELLRGETDFRRTIQVLPNGMHFLAAGKWSDEARQAAVGGRLEALLMRLKEPFDCVVLHGHALLTVAESVEVARRSEVVLLCAQYRETRTPLVKKAVERIATMEIPFSGIVYVGATPGEAVC